MNLEFMEMALEAAKKSGSDIPVGCVIVLDDKILSVTANQREAEQRTTAHAEIIAIEEANKKLNNWRLNNCEMYVTLEPCPMCASAVIQSRISKLYFGAFDNINGAFGSNFDMRSFMESKINIKGGILEEECENLLKDYFRNIRKC